MAMKSVFDLLIDRVQEYGKYKGILRLDEDSCDNYISVSDIKKIIRDIEEEHNNGWIPCSERLPKEFDTVLVTMADDCLGFSHELGSIDIGYYFNRLGFCGACDTYSIDKIIAWQPLPPVYKGE